MNILAELTIRQQLEKYLVDHPIGRINTAELARNFNVTRQHICHQLDILGEQRHHRSPPITSYCKSCGIVISKNATYCRPHAKIVERLPGKHYQCSACKKYKVLEEFAKSSIAHSGYETRCLSCRAEWQRNYYRTEKGKDSHVKATRALLQKHPERQRAYYQVYKAIKNGVLQKESCYKCGDPNSQAIHSDYRNPLLVTWACLTCRSGIDTPKIDYIPNPLEDGFREFTKATIGKTNGLGRWLAIIKQHYNTSFITSQIFIQSIKDYKNIDGLGRQYKILAAQYADKLLIELLPENHS